MSDCIVALPPRDGVVVYRTVVVDADRLDLVTRLLSATASVLDAANAPGSPYHLEDLGISGRELLSLEADALRRCVLELRLAVEAVSPAA